MSDTEHVLHSAKLNNNCPECYGNNGLQISFVQQEIENRFYNKASKHITSTLYCYNCKTTIYPVNWTEDIERVCQYQKKQVVQRDTQIRLKSTSYIGVSLLLGGTVVLIYLASKLIG
jgi:hypothetical protein